MVSSSQPRLQRTLSVFSSYQEVERQEQQEWRSMTPEARLQAVEVMRQLNHPGYDPTTARLSRFYKVIESSES